LTSTKARVFVKWFEQIITELGSWRYPTCSDR
jgi:hypothetical protein